MKGLRTPTQPRQDDPKVERAFKDQARTVDTIAAAPGVNMAVLGAFELADGVETPIPHKLGKVPSAAWASFVRGPVTVGMIEEVTSSSWDRAKYLTLKASGYGATVTVVVVVVP